MSERKIEPVSGRMRFYVAEGIRTTMHEDQVQISTDLARKLISTQFPGYRDQPVTPVHGSGTVNAIFRIGTDLAARFPLRRMDPAACADMLRDEAAAMREFAESSPVASPLPVGIGRPGPDYPMQWTVQTWVEGEIATHAGLSGSAPFATDIAGLIATLRAKDTKGRRFDGRGRGGNLRDHDGWMELCFEKSAELLDVPELLRVWTRLRDLPRSGADLMSHRDLIPANLVVRGERLAGILDTGSFGPADPALDLVAAWHHFDRERRQILREYLGADELEWKRGAAWAFMQTMGLVWYYRSTNPTMCMLGRSTLSRLLEDPDI